MGKFVDNVVKVGSLGTIDTDFAGDAGADAARESTQAQVQAGREAIAADKEAAERAQGFFKPFEGIGQRGVEESSFLANPQEQFDFLQNNPLFNLALENANQKTLQSASANRRLSFGDTLQQLSNNTLLSASPLIDRQRQDIGNLLNVGTGIAGSQANIETGSAARIAPIMTDIGAAQGAGIVGAANARTAGTQQLLDIGSTAAAAAFSDERLKTNKRKIGKKGDHNWYSWDWNGLAKELFDKTGSEEGVMAHEVLAINPSAVILDESGFYKVNYGAL